MNLVTIPGSESKLDRRAFVGRAGVDPGPSLVQPTGGY
jgi:hypothetical protein